MTVTNGIDVTTTDALAEITLSRLPDGGWLCAAQRNRLLEVLAAVDPSLTAVLLRSADRVMARHPDGGSDLPGADDAAAPTLASLCHAVERCAVPVFVLLEGVVSGAGAEIALAAQGRIATPGARIVFSAGRLGRISGAGGTQRLPRLVGAEHALRLLMDAKPIPAPEALVIGLVDQIVEGETQAESLAAARLWVQAQAVSSRRPLGLADGRGFLQAVKAVRAAAVPGSLAMALADCTEAALLLPAEQGFALEATVAAERDDLPQTAALAQLVRAERAAAQTPEPLC
ncbi:MAG: enoyl-CoA hydratase/isomerase family protein, partial [Paracoccaceae bacterium]